MFNIQIQIAHNQLNGKHVEIPNTAFFDDSIPMKLPHTLYEWLKCTFLHFKMYSKHWKSYTISSVSQSPRVLTDSAIFSLENFPFWTSILDPEIMTHQSSICSSDFPLFYCNFSFRNALLSIFGNVKSTLLNIINNHPYPFLRFSSYFIAILHLA